MIWNLLNWLGKKDETDKLVRVCKKVNSIEPSKVYHQARTNFLASLQDNQEIPPKVYRSLSWMLPHGAARLAFILGEAVEYGANREKTARAVFKIFRDWIMLWFPYYDVENPPQLSRLVYLHLDALPLFCEAIIKLIGPMPEFRQEIADDAEFMDKLDNMEIYYCGIRKVRKILEVHSDSVVVIHVESQKAFELEYENVNNNFHLFSLIQSEIGDQLPGGTKPTSVIYDAARGGVEDLEAGITEYAWWHFGRGDVPEANLAGSIWGEDVCCIPKFDGKQVILLWPTIMKGRFWGANFFGPFVDAALPKIQITKELNRPQVTSWFNKLGLA